MKLIAWLLSLAGLVGFVGGEVVFCAIGKGGNRSWEKSLVIRLM